MDEEGTPTQDPNDIVLIGVSDYIDQAFDGEPFLTSQDLEHVDQYVYLVHNYEDGKESEQPFFYQLTPEAVFRLGIFRH